MVEGTTVGSYRIVRKLGEGGMGAVYVAEHTLLGRRAALKVLLPSLSADREIVQRFFNEARAVTQIADPGIVQVFDFGYHTDGSAYIVMELLEGEPMDKRLERTRVVHLLDALRLIRQIATSLARVHAAGIVHRDLKPENIFIVGDAAVTGGHRAKILDFGIAKVSAEAPGKLRTRTGMVMGTPVYMSPEQCRGAGDIDRRSDVYSLGCVMFSMIAGSPPFDGEGAGDLIAAHLREPAPLVRTRVPGIPDVIDEVLQRCLAKTPADRYQSMMELVDALDLAEDQLLRASSATIALRTTPASGGMSRSTLGAASGEVSPVAVASRPRGKRLAVAALAVVAFPVGIAAFAARPSKTRAAVAIDPVVAVDAGVADAPIDTPTPDAAPQFDAAPELDAATPPAAVTPPITLPPPRHHTGDHHVHAVSTDASVPHIDRGD